MGTSFSPPPPPPPPPPVELVWDTLPRQSVSSESQLEHPVIAMDTAEMMANSRIDFKVSIITHLSDQKFIQQLRTLHFIRLINEQSVCHVFERKHLIFRA